MKRKEYNGGSLTLPATAKAHLKRRPRPTATQATARGLRGELILVLPEATNRQTRDRGPLSPPQGPDMACRSGSELELAAIHGAASQLLAGVSARGMAPDLIVASNESHFHDIVDIISGLPAEIQHPSADILVLTEDASFCQPAYWRNPDGYVRVIYPSNVVVGQGFVLFSARRKRSSPPLHADDRPRGVPVPDRYRRSGERLELL
jgi:hypothetical protein